MNFNLSQFLLQSLAIGAWVFVAAGVYMVVEKLVRGKVPPPYDPSQPVN